MKGALLLAAAVFVFCSCSAEAALSCTPVATDPCLCVGKYFILDINHLFDYPVRNIPDGVNPEKYNYTYSPCRPVLCNSTTGDTAAVCQYLVYRNENHNCGEVNKTEWRISEEGPLNFEIEYRGGDVAYGLPRISIVSFASDGMQSKDTIEMVKEEETESNIIYHFQVMIADSARFTKSFKHMARPGFTISKTDNQ